MTAFDLYGFKDATLAVARAVVEKALGIRFVEAENSFTTCYFWYLSGDGESIKLFNNYNVVVNSCREPNFEEYPVVLYVDGTIRSEEVKQRLAAELSQIELIRHTEH